MVMLALDVVLGPSAPQALLLRVDVDDGPTRGYLLRENYCVDPDCDCRRVLLQCIDLLTHEVVATISHAFDAPDELDADMGQTFLDPLHPRGRDAAELCDVVADLVKRPDIVERLEHDYALVKQAIAAPDDRLRELLSRTVDPLRRPIGSPAYPRGWRDPPARRAQTRARNGPCWCGSGKKYKRCHLDADERTAAAADDDS